MASVISICNSALIKLGANRITALTETSKEARLCNAQYEVVRDRLLQSHPWNFAIKRIALNKLSEVPAFGWDGYYQLPTDYLRVLTVFPDYPFEVEGDRVLSDAGDVSIRYMYSATDPSKYPPRFAEALAYELAKELSYALVQSNAQQAQLFTIADDYLRKTRSYDAQEGTPQQFFSSSWVDSRDGYDAI